MSTALVWFRRDLRLGDNPALTAALEAFDTVVPVFVWAPDEEGDWPPGGAHRWYLHHSLAALAADLEAKGSRLILRHGASADELLDVARQTGAQCVFYQRRLEPAIRERDAAVDQKLRAAGIEPRPHDGYILHDPDAIQTGSGGPYKVYSPFWKKLRAQTEIGPPLDTPRMGASTAPDAWPDSAQLDRLGLLPKIGWDAGLYDTWIPGERAAQAALDRFVGERLIDYPEGRDFPARPLTSELSMRLHWGEVSARQVWHAADAWVRNGAMREAADKFLSEIAWREFSYHLLWHFPHIPDEPLRSKYAAMPWEHDADALRAWEQGWTGYPIVDAGMRQLWHIGWMHNRVRMITASFLTKDLLIAWQEGARWFWDTLVGGDLANNTQGWQWTAGSGADAQPFFRVFNPVSQSERYDPDGAYIRRWVPELAELPTKHLHAPWTAPAHVLRAAGVTLGETYPHPIVDHAEARLRALSALDAMKAATAR
jgi:deoxyribodipyrimidine photo-lyase